jgi:hypothetical protein
MRAKIRAQSICWRVDAAMIAAAILRQGSRAISTLLSDLEAGSKIRNAVSPWSICW